MTVRQALLIMVTAMSFVPLRTASTRGESNTSMSLAAASPARAASHVSLANYEARIQELEQRLANLESSPACEAANGCGSSCPGWFASADYLYWQVERDDLGYAINDPVGLGVPGLGQPVLSMNYGSANGFRMAGGRKTASGWQVDLRYTYLRSDDTRVYAPGGGQVLAVLSSPATGLTNADTVNAFANFSYDVIDLEAGHWLDVGDSLSVLVLAGIRYASIDQRIQANYNGGAFINGTIDIPTNIDAFGGRLGGMMHWDVGSNLSLFGCTALSVCGTNVDASRRETSAGPAIIDASRSLHPVLTSVELQLGLRSYFRGWSLAAGYEWTNWFNAVSPLEFADNFNGGTLGPTQRDLGLHGLFATMSYAF